MKKCYRFLCFLLVLVMLVSCTNGNEPVTPEESTTPQTEEITEETGTLIVRNGIPQYTVVYADGLNARLLGTAAAPIRSLLVRGRGRLLGLSHPL